jgi:DNA invertase Pin-like site-specific DNA recombinase
MRIKSIDSLGGFGVQNDGFSQDLQTRRDRIRAGQARARANGRIFGRRQLYTDEQIREAVRLHEAGATWPAAAAAIGISPQQLYTRVRKLRARPRPREIT